MNMKIGILLSFLFFVVFSCSSQSNYCIENRFSESYSFDSSEITVLTDINFAVSKRWPSNTIDSLKLDVFAPDLSADDLNKRPFILLMHGGAFLAGNRTDMHYQCMEYARRGFVVATIGYRLGWNCAATDLLGACLLCQGENYKLKTATYRAVQDARAALRFLHANADTYGIDTSWIFVGGESAGSITALHTAFWNQNEADSFASWAKGEVGLIDTAGNSLPNTFSIKGVIDNCGAVSRDSIVVNKGEIPIVSFHDENDCVVPNQVGQVISCVCQPFYWAWGSSAIHNKMNQAGLCTEMNLVPLSLNHCSYPTWNLVRHASCFLKRILCNDCQTGYSNNTIAPVSCNSIPYLSSLAVKINATYPLNYFPNPTRDKVQFDLSNFLSAAPLNISIVDANGKSIEHSKGINAPQYITQTNLIAAGIYFVQVSSSNKILATTKLIVQP